MTVPPAIEAAPAPTIEAAPPAALVQEAAPAPVLADHDYFKYTGKYAYKHRF